jgi:MFS family permease
VTVNGGPDREAVDRPSPPLWRNRDFMILWTGETISTLGSSMSMFVFPVIGYTISGSATAAAAAGSAFALGRIVLRLPAGAWVDRWNRRTVMVASNALGALLYGSLVGALALGVLTLAHLVAVAFLSGIVSSFFHPAEQAAIRHVVPTQQLPTAFSQDQARMHVAQLVGPPLAGALYSVTRWAPFLADTVTYAVSAVALTRIRTPLPAPPRDDTTTSMWQDIVEGLRFLVSRGFLRAIVAFAAIANFTANALFLVLTLKLLQAGVHPAAIGLIDTIGAVAGIAGALVAPWLIRRVPTGALAIAAGVLIGLVLIPMAFTNDVLTIGVLLAVGLFGMPAGNAAVTSYLTTTTPDRLLGRTTAALGFSASLFMPLGPIVGGVLLTQFGGRTAMLITAVLTALSALPLVLSAETRRLPRPDQWPVDPEQSATAGLGG